MLIPSGARERVLAVAARAGFSLADLGDIEIAVGEAVTNAILYGSPTADSGVTILIGLMGHVFHVEVRVDEDTDALGGRGLRLMWALMDEVELHYGGQGMVAQFTKNLPR